MTEIQPVMHPLLQCAFLCLMLSNIGWHLLWLRGVLLFASVFFILAGILVFDVAVDTVLWNSIFLIINVIYGYPLVREKLPVKLNPEQNELYENVFKDVFNKLQFIKFYKRCIKAVRVEEAGHAIVREKDLFKHLYILGDVEGPDAIIELDKAKTLLHRRMPSWSWIGILEYIDKYETKQAVSWTWFRKLVSNAENKGSLVKDAGLYNVGATITGVSGSNTFVYYKISMSKMEAYFKKLKGKKHEIRNGILAKMLAYVATYIDRQNEDYLHSLKKVESALAAHEKDITKPGDVFATVGDDAEKDDIEEHSNEEAPLKIN